MRPFLRALPVLLVAAFSVQPGRADPIIPAITGEIVPDKTRLVLGEPVWITSRLKNNGADTMYVEVPPPGLQAQTFQITAVDETGNTLTGHGAAYGGPGPKLVALAPGKDQIERLFLPNWFSLPKPG